MSVTFTKLFSSITQSTVWGYSAEIRIVWITLLAMADAKGRIFSTVPGLARTARVSRKNVEDALVAFSAPDPDSRTADNDGRRIEAIDGGWRLLNYAKYRERQEEGTRRAKWREQKERQRARTTADNGGLSTNVRPEEEAEGEEETPNLLTEVVPGEPGPPACPHEQIIEIYHEVLPMLPRVKIWNDQRRAFLRARWREDPKRQSLEFWRRFFAYVGRSPFLTGGKKEFVADLEWIVRPTNFAKIVEGRYHERRRPDARQ